MPKASSRIEFEHELHAQGLRRLARRLVGEPHRADDVVQDAWLAALRRPPSRDDRWSSWLRGVIRNIAHHVRRGERRRRVRERRCAQREEVLDDDHLETVEIHALVRAALRSIPEPFRRTVVLRFYENLSAEEIAQLEGVPAGTVRSRLKRGLDRLRAELGYEKRQRRNKAGVLLAWVPRRAERRVKVRAETMRVLWLSKAFLGILLVGGTTAGIWFFGESRESRVRNVQRDPSKTGSETRSPRVVPSFAAEPPTRYGFFEPPEGRWRGRGTIQLRLVDDLTEDAIPGLDFTAFGESPFDHPLGHGTCDTSGRVTLHGLPAEVVLIETERRPPYAPSMAAVSLPSGDLKSVELRVVRGGILAGRVVDDRGRPVADCDISIQGLARRPRSDPMSPAATTDFRGRFRLESVVSRPKGVWSVNDRPRPERWLGVRLALMKNGRLARVERQVRDGETVELPDTVLPRRSQVSGTLLDPVGRPVSGAYLKVGFFPAEPCELPRREEMTELECVTGNFGEFTVKVPAHLGGVTVRTRDAGPRQLLGLPRTKPGAMVEGVVLRLESSTALRLDLTQAGGGPITHPKDPEVPPFVFVDVYALGQRLGTQVANHEDGSRYRLSIPSPGPRIVSLRIRAGGYQPYRHEFVEGISSGESLRFVLEPLHRLNLDIRPDDGDRELVASVLKRTPLCLRACLSRRALSEDKGLCCGLGGFTTVRSDAELRTAALGVTVDEPYWLQVGLCGLASAPSDDGDGTEACSYSEVFGPFRPGPTPRPVRLPTAKLERFLSLPVPVKELPAASQPAENLAVVVAQITDALTGETLQHGRLGIAPSWGHDNPRSSTGFDPAGQTQLRVEPGQWQIRATAEGYMGRMLSSLRLDPGDRHDLGIIPLQPEPPLRGRLLEQSGEPVAAETAVVLHLEGQERPRRVLTREDGHFEVRSLAPSIRLLRLNDQWLKPSSRDESGLTTFQCREARSVEVWIAGFQRCHEESTIDLLIRYPRGSPEIECLAQAKIPCLQTGQELPPSRAGVRRFRFKVVPGRFELDLESALYRLRKTQIVVASRPASQVIRVFAEAHGLP